MKAIQLTWMVGLVGLLLLAGCTGTQNPADTSNPNNNNSANPPATGDNTNPPANGNDVTFSDLWNMQSGLNHRIEYKVTMTGTSNELPVSGSKYIYYFKQNKMRTDITASTSQGSVETRMYFSLDDKSKVTNCTQFNGQWNCTFITIDKLTEQGGTVPGSDAINESDYTITPDGTKTAAGLTGNCFKLVSKDPELSNYEARYCITSNGIPIYSISTAGNGTVELEATSVTNNVTDADFTPPATPREMVVPGADGSGLNADMCNQLPEGESRDACVAAINGS